MKTRLACCGHAVPSHPGRQRLACNGCRPPVVREARPESVECERCGVDVLTRPAGRLPRWCETCRSSAHLVVKQTRPCARCGTKFDTHLPTRLYCSTFCGNVARGVQLAQPYAARSCALAECQAAFTPKSARQRCCSEKHGKLLYNRESRADGRQPMVTGDPVKRRTALRRKTQLRRARSRGVEAETVDRDVVGDRDGWKCGICRRKVDRTLPYPHRRSASLDHIVPLSEHGPHTYANVRITHLACNTARSNRGGNEQLALVG